MGDLDNAAAVTKQVIITLIGSNIKCILHGWNPFILCMFEFENSVISK